MDRDYKYLVDDAINASKNSYSPYSNFKVGAALLAKSGKVYSGCNVENSSYGATNCAERTALVKAISEGEKEFEAIAIVGGLDFNFDDICFPCGICRQSLSEFCDDDMRVVLAKYVGENKEIEIKEFRLGDLIPNTFR